MSKKRISENTPIDTLVINTYSTDAMIMPLTGIAMNKARTGLHTKLSASATTRHGAEEPEYILERFI